eukprot:3286964-Rhodomonas_salina.2
MAAHQFGCVTDTSSAGKCRRRYLANGAGSNMRQISTTLNQYDAESDWVGASHTGRGVLKEGMGGRHLVRRERPPLGGTATCPTHVITIEQNRTKLAYPPPQKKETKTAKRPRSIPDSEKRCRLVERQQLKPPPPKEFTILPQTSSTGSIKIGSALAETSNVSGFSKERVALQQDKAGQSAKMAAGCKKMAGCAKMAAGDLCDEGR